MESVRSAFQPLIDFKAWFDRNAPAFREFFEFALTIEERFEGVGREAVHHAARYKWFITPSMPANFLGRVISIGQQTGNQRRAMNRLFVDYYKANDWQELSQLVESWSANPIFRPRMKILRDCLSTVKRSDRGLNPANVVLPTLIAQIDGIQTDIMRKHGILRKRTKWVDAMGKEVNWKNAFRSETSSRDFMDSTNDVFLNILFQRAYFGEPLANPFSFNRHKIMHGEVVRYGTIDNTVRAFLLLEFLSHV